MNSISKNNQTGGGMSKKEGQELLTRFVATAPHGMNPIAAVFALGDIDAWDFADVLIQRDDDSSSVDQALAAATHILVLQFQDGQGVLLAGTLKGVEAFLRKAATPEVFELLWISMFLKRHEPRRRCRRH
jgi:hypothetical protein